MPMSPAVIGAMVAQIAGVFKSMVPELGMIPGISADVLATVTNAIDDLEQAATAFSAADAPGDVITRIETDAEAVLTVLAALPLPPQVALGFRIVQFVLPVLLAAAKMVTSATT